MSKVNLIHGDNTTGGNDVEDVVSFHSIGRNYTSADNGKTFFYDKEVIFYSTKSKTLNGSAPESLNGDFVVFYCDPTGGNIDLNLNNPALFADHPGFTFKRITSASNLIRLNPFGSEQIEFATGTQTIIPILGRAITIRTNGTDWFIIADKT